MYSCMPAQSQLPFTHLSPLAGAAPAQLSHTLYPTSDDDDEAYGDWMLAQQQASNCVHPTSTEASEDDIAAYFASQEQPVPAPHSYPVPVPVFHSYVEEDDEAWLQSQEQQTPSHSLPQPPSLPVPYSHSLSVPLSQPYSADDDMSSDDMSSDDSLTEESWLLSHQYDVSVDNNCDENGAMILYF